MLALILACTITTPCIYIDPNPTLPGITNMAGGPDIAKDMTHDQTHMVLPTPPHTHTPLTPPRTTPQAHAIPHIGTNVHTRNPGIGQALYTVQPGDCLYTIALHYQTTWQTLWAHNPTIADPDLIWPDQVIVLP